MVFGSHFPYLLFRLLNVFCFNRFFSSLLLSLWKVSRSGFWTFSCLDIFFSSFSCTRRTINKRFFESNRWKKRKKVFVSIHIWKYYVIRFIQCCIAIEMENVTFCSGKSQNEHLYLILSNSIQTIWSFRFKISMRLFLFSPSSWASNPMKFVWFILGFSTLWQKSCFRCMPLKEDFLFVCEFVQIPILSESKVTEVVFTINLSCFCQSAVGLIWNL